MWSALKNVSSLVENVVDMAENAVETGLSKANEFLEDLDRVDDDGKEMDSDEIIDDDDEQRTNDMHENLESKQIDPLSANEDIIEGEADFYTPLKGPDTTAKKTKMTNKTSKSLARRGLPSVEEESLSPTNELKQIIVSLQEENTFLKTSMERLSNELTNKRVVFESELAEQKRLVETEMSARSKAEAELAHVKKVAVSPKTHKEVVKMVDILKAELAELESVKTRDEQTLRNTIMALEHKVEAMSSAQGNTTGNRDDVERLEERASALEAQLAEQLITITSLQVVAAECALREEQAVGLLKLKEEEHRLEIERLATEDEERLLHMKATLESALIEERKEEDDHEAIRDKLDVANAEVYRLQSELEVARTAGSDKGVEEFVDPAVFAAMEEELAHLKYMSSELESELQRKEDAIAALQAQLDSGMEVALSDEVGELKAELEDLTAAYKRDVDKFARKEAEYTALLEKLQAESSLASGDIQLLQNDIERYKVEHKAQVEALRHAESGPSGSTCIDLEEMKAKHAEELKAADEKMQELVRSLESTQAELQHVTSQHKLTTTQLELHVTTLEEEMSQQVSALAVMEDQLVSGNTNAEDLQRLADELASKDIALFQKDVEIRELSESLQKSEEERVATLGDIGEVRGLIADAVSVQETLKADNAELEGRLLHTQEQVQDLSKALSEKEAEAVALQETITTLRNEISTLDCESMNEKLLKSENVELGEQLLDVKEQLELLTNTLSEKEGALFSLNNEAESLQGIVATLRNEISARDNESSSTAQLIIAEKAELEERLAVIQGQVELLSKTLSEKEAVICTQRGDAEALHTSIAALQTQVSRLETLLVAEKESSEAEIQDRIIANAELSESIRDRDAAIASLEKTMQEMLASDQDLARQLLVSQSALESERSSAQAALVAERQSISVLTVALNEAKATSEIQSSKLQSLIIENEKLKSDCESLLSSAKEKESAHAALAARAQEAESALSLLETKKKRDLEFLRKQNENISALQRQIDELKAGTEDSESDLKAKVVRAERTASEATKQVEQLQTALVSSHQELELLRGKLAGLPRVNKEDEVEVISNYAGSLVSKPGADEVVEKLRAQLLVSEEEKIRLEVTLADTLEAKKVVEQALSLKVEELSRSVKSLSAKISALEEERERLEDELRNYQQSVRGVNNESGGYAYRGGTSSPLAYVDIEGGNGELDESVKKEGGEAKETDSK